MGPAMFKDEDDWAIRDMVPSDAVPSPTIAIRRSKSISLSDDIDDGAIMTVFWLCSGVSTTCYKKIISLALG